MPKIDPTRSPTFLRLAAAPSPALAPDRATGQSWSLHLAAEVIPAWTWVPWTIRPPGPSPTEGPLSLPRPHRVDEHRCVMVGHAVLRNGIAMAAAVQHGLLPLTKAVQDFPAWWVIPGWAEGMDRVRYAGTSHPGGNAGSAEFCGGGRWRNLPSPHLVLREQGMGSAGDQDINDVSQTQVLKSLAT